MPANAGSKRRKFPPVAGAAIIAVLFLLFGLYTIDDFGITWDEPVHFASGDVYLDVILDHDRPLTFSNSDFEGSMQYYGPVFDIWGALNHRLLTETLNLLPEDNARHLHLLLASAVTVFFTYLLVQSALTTRIAIYSSLFLVSFPRFVGHSFNNPKDIPLACIFVISIFLFHRRLMTGKKAFSILLAIAGGIGFATRIQYALVPIVIITYIIIYNCILGKSIRTILNHIISYWDLFLAVMISIPIGIIFWPYLWTETLVKLQRIFEFYAYHRTQAQLVILYRGRDYIPGLTLPWHYAPVMLAITTPLITLGSSLLGFWLMIVSWLKDRLNEISSRSRNSFYLLLILWVSIGIFPFILPGQRVYGGIRHFLFIIPALCIIAGIGLDKMTAMMGRKIERWAYLIVVILFSLLFVSVYSYHPFYTVYYNSLVGGPRGAFNRYNLENWGNSYKGACRWLNENASEGSTVLALIVPFIPRFYLRQDIKVLGRRYARRRDIVYDYSIYILRDLELMKDKDKPPVFSLSVKGQPICNVHRW